MGRCLSTSEKQDIAFLSAFGVSIGIFVALLYAGVFDLARIRALGSSFSFFTALLAGVFGFFFLLIQQQFLMVIDRPRVARMYRSHYLQQIPRATVIGVSNAAISMTAVLASEISGGIDALAQCFVWAQMFALIIEIVFFFWGIRIYAFVIWRLCREDTHKELRAEDVLKKPGVK